MGISKVIYVPDKYSQNYKPLLVPSGTYFCMDYPSCKGKQVVRFDDTEIQPCPICGKRILFSQ